MSFASPSFVVNSSKGVVSAKEAGIRRNVCNSRLSQEEAEKLASQKSWLNLLHYREGTFRLHSEADGPRFFMSEDGYSDATAELQATLDGFCKVRQIEVNPETKLQRAAQCVFPARERFFKKSGLAGWSKEACPELNGWKQRVGNAKVSLVFSSYYANNPSSIFGHTLLRIDKEVKAGEFRTPLLSYGVNFAANVTTNNPVAYGLGGLMGGFPGVFTTLPYYYKVRQYSDFDSRDLWEYELDFTPEQVEQLLDHIWEQSHTHYNYYYFTENCSYHLLTTLDTIVPEQELAKKIPYWVIPIDTIKAVTMKSTLLKKVTYRPSLYRQFKEREKRVQVAKLESEFQSCFQEGEDSDSVFEGCLDKEKGELSKLDNDQQALVLDAVLDYWDFKHARDLLDPKSQASQSKLKILRRRAQLPKTKPLNLDGSDMERPDLAHETARLTVIGGHDTREGPIVGFDTRFALHDFLDPGYGYPKTAQVEFGKLNGYYATDKEEFFLQEFKAFNVKLVTPYNKYDRAFSWQVQLAMDRQFYDCDGCLGGGVLYKWGSAVGTKDKNFLAYLMGGVDARHSGAHRTHQYMALPMLTPGVIWRAHKWLNFETQFDYVVRSLYGLENGYSVLSEMRVPFQRNLAAGFRYRQFNYEPNDVHRYEGYLQVFF
ncbi:MAG: DUF4105 domain-containing protein [Pseudomonadota bacterium]